MISPQLYENRPTHFTRPIEPPLTLPQNNFQPETNFAQISNFDETISNFETDNEHISHQTSQEHYNRPKKPPSLPQNNFQSDNNFEQILDFDH